MKAIILAAGCGLRIREHHIQPKGLIEIEEQTLITRSVNILKQCGIVDILLVVGYGAEHYELLFARDPRVRLVYNEKFDVYESLYSLYCAKDWVNEDVFLLESDILYEPLAITTLLESNAENAILISQPSNSDDEVFVETNDQNHLVRMNKNLDALHKDKVCGEFVGISKINHKAYQELLLLLVNNPALLHSGKYEEEGLVWVAKTNSVSCVPCWDLLWCEIDNLTHLEKAKKISQKILHKQHTVLQSLVPIKRNILLNPGPVTTSNSVKRALLVPDVCHREKEFTDLVATIRNDLLKVVNASSEDFTTIPICASGTGAIEACLSSVIAENDSVLIINNGSYGQRLVDIANCYNINVVEQTSSYNEDIDLAAIENTLKNNQNIKHIAVVHHETSSGIMNPIDKIGEICLSAKVNLIVDAMSSIAGRVIDMPQLGVDYLIASSNKCLHGMPGLSFVIADKAKLESTTHICRNFYFNLLRTYKALESTFEMPFTPPVQVIYSLRQALNELLTETVPNRSERFKQRYLQLKSGMEKLGFSCLTPENKQSYLLMMLQFPKETTTDFSELHDFLYGKGYTIYPRKLSLPNSFRLSNIGELTADDIDCFLKEVAFFMEKVSLELGV